MDPLPHHYTVIAAGTLDGALQAHADGLPTLDVASPREFGGPGNTWSPESLLVAAVANCFVLTFRAVAAASKVAWTRLDCDVTGTLDRVDRAMQFTHFDIHARLSIPECDHTAALRALDKAHRGCLIANSLKASIDVQSSVAVDAADTQAVTR